VTTPLVKLWQLQTGLSDRLAQLFAEEELYGLKLAAQVRTAVFLALLLVASIAMPAYRLPYICAVSVIVAGIAWLHYAVRKRWRQQRALSYLVTLLDFSVMVVAYAQPDFLTSREVPIQAANQLGAQRTILLLIVLYAFTARPILMIWAGVSAALAWGGLWLYMITLPDSLHDSAQAWAGRMVILDPYFVGANRMLMDAALFVIAATCLAMLVVRLRGLVAQRAGLERERTNLARYFPRQTADELAGRDSPFDAPQVRPMAVVFVDMVGFTERIDGMDPVETIDFLRDFHRVLTECAFAHGGAVEKFLGDGVMVTFGRLHEDPQDAARAVTCAQAMVSAVAAWTAERGDREPVGIGVGIHFGPVVMGDIGSDQRVESAVLGDVVNLSSRIESMTRQLGYPILFSQEVQAAAAAVDAAPGLELAVLLGPQKIRGSSQELALYGLRPAAQQGQQGKS